MPWLDNEPCELARNWLRLTSSPMLASEQNGRIVWCNRAFEELLGYTLPEFTRERDAVLWTDITVARDDLDADTVLVQELIDGTREEYTLAKQYRRKNGTPADVIINVRRWPRDGADVHCFLVSVYPIGQEHLSIVQHLAEIRAVLAEVISKIEREANRWQALIVWAEQHPKAAMFIGAIVAGMLFGEQFFVSLERVAGAVLGGNK